MSIARVVRRLLQGLALGATVIVFAVGGLAAYAWFEHRRDVTLPAPTGSFAIGRVIEHWKDDATLDALAPVAGAKRELLVWIWYPSDSAPSAVSDEYVPSEFRNVAHGGGNIWTLLTRDVARVHGHSRRNAEFSRRQQSYPVVIMRAGASSGVGNYSTLAEDLASHGYIVVGFDAPYRTSLVKFADGRAMTRTVSNNPESCVLADQLQMERCAARIMNAWNSDIAFVLDRLTQRNAADSSGKFTGRLDMARVGVFGHSLGGAVAAQFCRSDSRCLAGIDIDGALHGPVIHSGVSQPFMFLLSDHGTEVDSGSVQIKRDIQEMYDHLPADRRLRVAIKGAFHFTFSDDGALLKSSIVRGVLRLTGKLGIDARRQLAVTAYCVRSFFDAYLKQANGSTAFVANPLYPEISMIE